MDVGVLAKRIVLYVVTSAALAPILFVGLWGFDQVGFGRPSAAISSEGVGTLTRDAIILLLVFTVALPLLRNLEGGLERLMFRRRHGVRDALVRLIKELGSLLEVSALGRTLTDGLVTRVPVLSAGLYRYDAAAARFTRLAHATFDAADAPTASPVLDTAVALRSEEHTSELQSRLHLVCRLLLEKKKKKKKKKSQDSTEHTQIRRC